MSTVEANVEVSDVPVPEMNDLELTAARNARVGAMTVRRMLPLRLRRSVGAWCFIDHYGPMDTDGVTGMNVPPHPHIGLQTVTWLLRGNVLHRDSLGTEQLIRPGQLNLMTSGRGIAHAEESVPDRAAVEADPVLHGVQLWVALPDASRHVKPAFEYHAQLPTAGLGGFGGTVFIGELAGTGTQAEVRSPATAFSPIVGAELTAAGRHADCVLPLRPDFEHVIFVAAGQAEVEGIGLEPGQLLYLPTGRYHAAAAAPDGSTLFLLGGEPLGEQLLMWWNFVARTPEEIAAATARWRAGGFGPVGGYQGEPLEAPPLEVARLRRPPAHRAAHLDGDVKDGKLGQALAVSPQPLVVRPRGSPRQTAACSLPARRRPGSGTGPGCRASPIGCPACPG
jgi:quercetin 2,3-dioxygenase